MRIPVNYMGLRFTSLDTSADDLRALVTAWEKNKFGNNLGAELQHVLLSLGKCKAISRRVRFSRGCEQFQSQVKSERVDMSSITRHVCTPIITKIYYH